MTGHSLSRRGFTLIEVLTALAVTGLVAMLAHRLVGVCTDSVHALATAQREQDRAENGRRWLRAAFLSLEVGSEAGGFEGNRDQLAFSTWLEAAGGWFAPSRITMAVASGALVASGGTDGPVTLADSVIGLDLDYLLEPGADTKWVRQWLSPLSAPLAVRLRIARREGDREVVDTILCLIKERG